MFEKLAPFLQLANLNLGFGFFHEKKQNDKISHENEAKNRRPKRAPIVRGAKRGANYAEFGIQKPCENPQQAEANKSVFQGAQRTRPRPLVDGIGDFGETIPNFLAYVYRKVKLAFYLLFP